jgi:hypothetical protein
MALKLAERDLLCVMDTVDESQWCREPGCPMSEDRHIHAWLRIVTRTQSHHERLRPDDVHKEVDTGDVADLDVEQTLEIPKRVGERRCFELKDESRVAPEVSLSVDKDSYAFGVDVATSPEKLIGRCAGLCVFEVDLRTLVFILPAAMATATLSNFAAENVGVNGIA